MKTYKKHKLGLALGSGGARGMALLGALKAFAFRIFAGLEIATRKVDVLLVVVSATAVKGFLQFTVVHSPQLLARVAVVVMLRGGSRVYA